VYHPAERENNSFYFEFVDGALYTVDSTYIDENTAVLRVLML
jgi:hypothetical protein